MSRLTAGRVWKGELAIIEPAFLIARQLFCRKTAKSFEINQAFANLQNVRRTIATG
jgi:hypothetical protein